MIGGAIPESRAHWNREVRGSQPSLFVSFSSFAPLPSFFCAGLQSGHGKSDVGVWSALVARRGSHRGWGRSVKLKNGREARVTMHILEGGKEEIEKQLKTSLAAFFDFYPEI